MRLPFATTLIAALAVAAPTLALAQQGGCSRGGFRYGLGIAETSAIWRVTPGKPCTASLNLAGTMRLTRLSIEQPARVGLAGTGSRYQFAYNPRPGQTERDQFVLRIDFEQRGVPGVTRVRIDVAPRRR